MGGISAALPDNDRGYYRYRGYHLLRNGISYPVVVLHHQCGSDDICHQDIRSAIQHKDYLCNFHADFPAMDIPGVGKQLHTNARYVGRRKTSTARQRTGLYGLYHRCGYVWCRSGHYFQL